MPITCEFESGNDIHIKHLPNIDNVVNAFDMVYSWCDVAAPISCVGKVYAIKNDVVEILSFVANQGS